jgi:hypothetical protein
VREPFTVRTLTRRAMLRVLLGLAAVGSGLWELGCSARDAARGTATPSATPTAGMMGGVSSADMSRYMELFNRHTEIRRTVERISGGVRTTTEVDDPVLVAQLQEHVTTMYQDLDRGQEVTCMSPSLPTLFRRANGYQRHLTLTAKGVSATETSTDPHLAQLIRDHANEVSGFVRDGMPSMMQGMMGGR